MIASSLWTSFNQAWLRLRGSKPPLFIRPARALFAVVLGLILTVACSTNSSRRKGPEYHHVSKNKVSQDCYGTVAVCLQEIKDLAKKECESENRIYELEDFETTPTVSLRYRCKWLSEQN